MGASDPAVDEFDPLNDPAVGAQSLAASILSYSPATDKSPSDGAKRVKDRLTGKYLKAAGDDSAPKPKQWNTWAHDKSKIHTVVKLLDNVDIPADATQAVIPIQAKTSVWHADGDQTPLRAGYFIRVALSHLAPSISGVAKTACCYCDVCSTLHWGNTVYSSWFYGISNSGDNDDA